MWKPNDEGLKNLSNLLKESQSTDNTIQLEIFNKINQYSNHSEFPNYLIFILNSQSEEIVVRQIAGLTLKGLMEQSFINISDDSIDYFKENVLKCFLDSNQNIRKTISNLINTFIRHGGTEMWPEILNYMLISVDSEWGVEMSLETLNIIIEDSASFLESKHRKFLLELYTKLIHFFNSKTLQINIDNNSYLIDPFLNTIIVIFENCPLITDEIMTENNTVAEVLNNLHDNKNIMTRYNIGRCWLSVIRIRNDVLLNYNESLFNFFLNNLMIENYEMNFISAKFFLFILNPNDESERESEEKEDNNENNKTNSNTVNSSNDYILQSEKENFFSYFQIQKPLQHCLAHLHYMRLTPYDIAELDTMNYCNEKYKSNDLEENMRDPDMDSDRDTNNINGYNPSWTLRKCFSKLIDKLAKLYPEKVYELFKPLLEIDMQNQDWIVKEKSILALGAIGIGSYSNLRPHLTVLIGFLIRELQHPNKLIRAITCWTLSRFTKFILIDNLSDNSEEIFKEYLSNLLKKFLDPEVIVQEAACTAFSIMVFTKKEKLEPYLYDIFKIVTSALNSYSGTSLLTLYDIISLLTEQFTEHFKNVELIKDVVQCVVKKWSDMIQCQIFKSENIPFEMLISVIRVSSKTQIGLEYFDYFLGGSFNIIEYQYSSYKNNKCDINHLDHELISKCLDLISVLFQIFPENIKNYRGVTTKIVDYFFLLLETTAAVYLKYSLIAMIGDLCKVDCDVLFNKSEKIIHLLLESLSLDDSNPINLDNNKLFTCNNSCWSLGQFILKYPDQVKSSLVLILRRLLKILTLPRLNKSLAQNISICVGRLALMDPHNISQYLDSFLKQFCLSLRYVKDSQEKREAFMGLCQSILHNPNGVMNFFAFFCDAICQYDDAPVDLENLFQNIILSFKNTLKEKWFDYFNLFPKQLKEKMILRFRLDIH